MGGKIKQKYYVPDTMYYFINILWNFLWFSVGIAGVICLLIQEKINLNFLVTLFFAITAWMGILSTHISIRRFDKKYMDRILTDERSGSFLAFIPTVFAYNNMIKCRWTRFLVYFMSNKKMPTLEKLRKEIIPEFDYCRDVKFFDKFLCFGQFVSLLIFGGLFFFAKFLH